MQINQPQLNPNLPENLAKQIEQARQNLLILQADIMISRKTKDIIDRDIVKGKTALNDIENNITLATEKINRIIKDLESLQLEAIRFEEAKADRDKNAELELQRQSEILQEIAKYKKENAKDREDLDVKIANLNLRENLLNKRSAEISNKEERIRKLAEGL